MTGAAAIGICVGGCDERFCRQAAQAAFVVKAAGFSPTVAGWQRTAPPG